MDPRPMGPARSRTRLPGLAAVLLAGLLATIPGPGAAAAATATHAGSGTHPAPGTIAVQGDPIGDLAFQLDYDPDAIFRFVSDEIRYQPYDGILRGALGTLRARAGNSVDKSLLLAALLDASEVPYRFATGPLDATASAAIADVLPADLEAARREASPPASVASDVPVPATGGPLEALYQKQQAALAAQAEAGAGVAATRLQDTLTMLRTALDGAGVQLPADPAAPPLPAGEVAQHTWVQAQYGPEWHDLDATLPGAEAGVTMTDATATPDQLSDDLRYRVRFDVLAERVEGGALATHTILEQEDFADHLAGQPVTLSHVTPNSLARLGLSLSALLGEGWLDYRPTLQLGDRTFVADDTIGFPMGGGAGDVLSAEPEPSGGPAGPAEGEATAEWLEVTVSPPGGEPVTARRTLFDRLPVADRLSPTPVLADVAPATLVSLDGTGALDYPPMLGVDAFAIATGPGTFGTVGGATDDGLGLFGLAYHALRDSFDAQVALDAGARTYTDGPDIVSVSVHVSPDATPQDVQQQVRVGLDLWHRNHGVLPLAGATTTSAEARLVAGITDHLAERSAMERLAGDLGSAARTIGVGEVFEAAAAQGIPTVALRGAPSTASPYGPGAAAAIGQALAAGDVVVVPAAPVTIDGVERVGWWVVDPATGAAVDSMDDGSGSEFAEEGVIIRTRVGLVRCYGALALTVAGYLAAASSALTVMNILSNFRPGAGAGATCGAV